MYRTLICVLFNRDKSRTQRLLLSTRERRQRRRRSSSCCDPEYNGCGHRDLCEWSSCTFIRTEKKNREWHAGFSSVEKMFSHYSPTDFDKSLITHCGISRLSAGSDARPMLLMHEYVATSAGNKSSEWFAFSVIDGMFILSSSFLLRVLPFPNTVYGLFPR